MAVRYRIDGFFYRVDPIPKRFQPALTKKLFETFHRLVTGELTDVSFETLGKLAAFAGVSEFPARVKCASLAWHTMHGALDPKTEVVSTE